jgi:hypothetical protein
MTTTSTIIPAPVRRLLPAALFAATVALGIAACPAIAAAAPDSGTWDIEEYDSCLRQVNSVPAIDPIAREEEAFRYCCYRSGGVEVAGGENCVAPAATDSQQSSGGSRPLPTTLRPIPGDLLGPTDVAPPAAAP